MRFSNVPLKERDSSLSFSFDHETDVEEIGIDKIQDIIQCVLHGKFSLHSKTTLSLYTNRINFACPYCGDSDTDASKKRGNIYFEGFNFHCYNCGKHTSFHNFVKDFSQYCHLSEGQMTFLQGIAKFSREQNLKRKERIFSEAIVNPELFEKYAVTREEIKAAYGFTEASNSYVRRYLVSRLQDDYLNFLFDQKGNNLVMLNRSPDGQKIIGFQTRSLGPKKFFNTWRLSRIYEDMKKPIPEVDELDFAEVDALSMAYGILTVNLSEPITIFEGPMDAYLFPNSLALTGALKELPFETTGIRFMYDFDKTGRDQAFSKLQQGYQVFLWKMYIEDNGIIWLKNKLDWNDVIIYARRKSINLRSPQEYFSEDKLDAIYL